MINQETYVLGSSPDKRVVKQPALPQPKVRKPSYSAPSSGSHYYKVQAGVFSSKADALSLSSELNANGFETFVRKTSQGWRVQVGAFQKKSQAESLRNSLSAKGFTATVFYE